MAYIDLTCLSSVSLQNNIKSPVHLGELLNLGADFSTYLYFELPEEAFSFGILKAELFLFKIPGQKFCCDKNTGNRYKAAPLLDFFSIYSNWYEPPLADESLEKEFTVSENISFTSVDITPIANAWINGAPENKGLRMTGFPDAKRVVYGSNLNGVFGLRPLLRLTYERFSKPLSMAPCTVEVFQ